jgi:effector-binding domain-containing protein
MEMGVIFIGPFSKNRTEVEMLTVKDGKYTCSSFDGTPIIWGDGIVGNASD